jgi:hypothetical protein
MSEPCRIACPYPRFRGSLIKPIVDRGDRYQPPNIRTSQGAGYPIVIHFLETGRSFFSRAKMLADAGAGEGRDIGQGVPGEDQNFSAALNPMMRGSGVNTLVVRPLSSLFTKNPVIGVFLNRFLT